MCPRLTVMFLALLLLAGARRSCVAAGTFELAPQGDAAVAIVYGQGQLAAAEALREGLRHAVGVELAVLPDSEVVEPHNWRLRPEWLERPLIVLGRVDTNRVLFALFSHFLEGANAAYPGPGRYVLRVLQQPLRRGVPMIVVGASDQAGLAAGVARLEDLADEMRGSIPFGIELGDATGPTSRDSSFSGDFISAVGQYYWNGDVGAGRRARELLMVEASRPDKDMWGFLTAGHYDWERIYRPLRQLLATGILTDEERLRVDDCLATIATESQDWAGLAVLRSAPGAMTDMLTRHPISGLVGHYIIHEYLANVGDPPPDKREEVLQGYSLLRRHIETLIEDDRFMSNEVGTQGMDNLSFMAGMYLQLGDARVVERGIFRQMAEFYLAGKDNMGYQAGDDAYITCRPGCHRAYSSGGLGLLLATYFHQDGQYRWLLDNTHHFMSHMSVPQPPEIRALAAGVPPQAPERYRGLTVVPMDPWWYRQASGWKTDEVLAPVTAPREATFAKAVFRDGYDKDDAYLLLQGLNLGRPGGGEGFGANSVVRYTELGSLLLFANTSKQTSWARQVVSVSRGEADPQGTACFTRAQFNADGVYGIESVQENEGGTSWSRCIVRRHGAYFVILDELTAKQEDTYNLTCRWRSFHRGEQVAPRHFEAVDGMLGVSFHILGTTPAVWEVEEERMDGASRPTMVRQFQRVHLRAGESARFGNVLYADGPAAPRSFEALALGERAVLVRGRVNGAAHLAAIGCGPLSLAGAQAAARIWYAGSDALVIAGATSVRLEGLLELRASQGVSLCVSSAGRAWVENPRGESVEVTYSSATGAPVLLDGAPAAERLALAPGRHALELDAARLFGELVPQLEVQWARAAQETPAPPVVAGLRAEGYRFVPVWTRRGADPQGRRLGDVLASADPPVEIGDPAHWRDRMVCPPSGLGWHGSERAGWLPGAQGTIVLDLKRPTQVQEVRLIRARRYNDLTGVFRPDEFRFDVELSNDGFVQDVRRRQVRAPGFDVYYSENQHYMYTLRFPVFVVPIGEQTRVIRITPHRTVQVPELNPGGYWKQPDGLHAGLYQDAEISFMEIEVVVPDREPRVQAQVWCGDFGAGGGSRVLYQAHRILLMLGAGGELLWERDLGAPLAAPPVMADINGDGVQEILTYTLDEQLLAHDPNGNRLFTVDIEAAIGAEKSGGLCSTRPACIAAWRPDATGAMEYIFFPHYNAYRVSPAPELAVRHIEVPGGNRGGKFAFPIPDINGDGREELAVVGLYGFCFGVIASDAPLEQGQLPSYLTVSGLTGYSSGNQELGLYHDGAVVRDRAGQWLGVVALNPGGVDFFEPITLAKRWGHFNHPPNLCFLLHDLNADEVPEVLIGREDGHVVAYTIADGRVYAKAALDGPVRSLAAWGELVIAGTARGLTVLDAAMQPVGYQLGSVEDVAVLEPEAEQPVVVVALSSGEVVSYRLEAAAPGL